ncbi:cellulose-binding domain-containing protein [Streptomyces poriticola]|uniref:cellulose-binding domain-containing protein n=1 Tax=Streptomyces poriticola TaxID=3120506 RepID=UPI002FCE09A3
MPDLPSIQDAAEAALYAECWDAVLCYAELCTTGSEAATRLAEEAFGRGMREARAGADPAGRAGRRPARLPRIPLLLTAVRTTAADWEAEGQGDVLAPELRRWLGSDQAGRHTGPPPRRPLALRGLRDMPAPDAELLWLADVEALPLAVTARRIGLDPAALSGELTEVRALFRDRCRQAHRDAQLDPGCLGYARLLDAVTRTAGAAPPEDLSHHLVGCADCAEAAACLRGPEELPAALADGVLGWGGPAYLQRRRKAADARLGAAGHPADDSVVRAEEGSCRARAVRGGILVTAALVSLLALAVTLMPFGDAGEPTSAPVDTVDRRPVTLPDLSPVPTTTARPSSGTARPSRDPAQDHNDREDRPEARLPSGPHGKPDPEPQGTASATGTPPPTGTGPGPGPGSGTETGAGPPACRVEYDLVNQWPDGFQAAVTVTTRHALDSWSVGWHFPDGQQVGHMWDANHTQHGTHVTAHAQAYNASVPADGRFAFGFVASWEGKNSLPYGFTLNGRDCAHGPHVGAE